jgi:glycosyltransferase involved in cell wall biosynthesis
MFSFYFTLLPLIFVRLGWIKTQTVLAPRGMLKSSALAFKARKKSIFLKFFRWSGLARHIHFHASDEQERMDIIKALGQNCRITVAPSFPAPLPPRALPKVKHHPARFLFLGRVHPIKNLDLALKALSTCPHPANLTIIGGVEDASYWEKCQDIIKTMPSWVEVYHTGALPQLEVARQLPDFDFLLLPTQGENFGHAIIEAMGAGVPVIISDQTPWKDLNSHLAGWDLSLSSFDTWIQIVSEVACMPPEVYERWSRGAHDFARRFAENDELKKAYSKMFPL